MREAEFMCLFLILIKQLILSVRAFLTWHGLGTERIFTFLWKLSLNQNEHLGSTRIP